MVPSGLSVEAGSPGGCGSGIDQRSRLNGRASQAFLPKAATSFSSRRVSMRSLDRPHPWQRSPRLTDLISGRFRQGGHRCHACWRAQLFYRSASLSA
jgi:hypothetical protein